MSETTVAAEPGAAAAIVVDSTADQTVAATADPASVAVVDDGASAGTASAASASSAPAVAVADTAAAVDVAGKNEAHVEVDLAAALEKRLDTFAANLAKVLGFAEKFPGEVKDVWKQAVAFAKKLP